MCCYGKSHKLPFSPSSFVYFEPLQLIYIDIWGPTPFQSSFGARFYISFLDAYSKFTWIYLLSNKSQAFATFMTFKNLVENQLGKHIKSIQTDNAKEFLVFSKFLATNRIQHILSCLHIHEQNGSIERKHRHITKISLTLLANTSLPLTFWGKAFLTVVYLINLLPTPVLKMASPYQTLFHKAPDYHFLKTFGCACYPSVRPYRQHKLDFCSDLCLFLGYSEQHKTTNA